MFEGNASAHELFSLPLIVTWVGLQQQGQTIKGDEGPNNWD